MIPHFRAEARSGVGGEDDVGGLVGEVAVDALAQESAPAAWEEAAVLDLVTGETAGGEIGYITLRRMNVVTCRAGHIRRGEALAAFEQRDLVAVHVKRFVWFR